MVPHVVIAVEPVEPSRALTLRHNLTQIGCSHSLASPMIVVKRIEMPPESGARKDMNMKKLVYQEFGILRVGKQTVCFSLGGVFF